MSIKRYRQIARCRAAAGAVLLIIPLLAACGPTAPPTPTIPPTATGPASAPNVSYDFRGGAQGWQAGFADYPPGEETGYQLESGIRELPQPVTARPWGRPADQPGAERGNAVTATQALRGGSTNRATSFRRSAMWNGFAT